MSDQSGNRWRPGPGEIRVLVGRGEVCAQIGNIVDRDPLGVLHPTEAQVEVENLRRYAQERRWQWVFCTYSPVTINYLHPEEAVIVTGAPSAPVCRQMSEIPNIDRLLTGFTLGELWLAHADDEDALFRGVEP